MTEFNPDFFNSNSNGRPEKIICLFFAFFFSDLSVLEMPKVSTKKREFLNFKEIVDLTSFSLNFSQK